MLVILAANSSDAFAQTTDTTTYGHRSTSLLFEAGVGVRLNGRPDGRHLDSPGYLSWELGPLFNRGDWAWGVTIIGAGGDVGGRWGIRPRYERHLGSKVTLDLGGGMLLGAGRSLDGELDYAGPGFTGLVGLSYSNWLGVNLELHTIPTTAYVWDSSSLNGNTPSLTETDFTTWAWTLGIRTRGVAAVVLSAIELFLGMAAYSSMSFE